jgi:hypothetical protein
MCRVQSGIAATEGLGIEQAAERGKRGGGFVCCESKRLSHDSGQHIQEPKTENLLRTGSIQTDCDNSGNQSQKLVLQNVMKNGRF